jgi:hypothetical protein
MTNPYEPQPKGEPVNFCVRHLPPEPLPDFEAMNRLIMLTVNSSVEDRSPTDSRHEIDDKD